MKKSVIDVFIETCKAKKNKTAFVYRGREISFKKLLSDMYRMINLIKSYGLMPGDKALILVLPSYEFYLLMFAGICYGINLVAMDSYKDIGRIKNVLKNNGIGYVFCNSFTGLLKSAFGRGVKFINIKKHSSFCDEVYVHDSNLQSTVLTTFTSGTTGEPKPISRSITDFHEQINIISENISINNDDIVFSKLPIYSLFVVFSGATCVVSGKIRKNELKRHGVTAILAPIADLLALKPCFPFVKRVSIGGAMLYPREIEKIFSVFPNADITYVYGSSECVLMAKADLKKFRKTFALCTDISGVELSLVNTDKNGVGEICSRGKVVLTDSKEQVSNDLGYVDKDGLHIVGRKAFSAVDRYNYLIDIEVLSVNKKVKKGFSLVYKENIYFCYEGTVSSKRNDIVYVRFRKLPMDLKHKTKLDYNKALSVIKKKNQPRHTS